MEDFDYKSFQAKALEQLKAGKPLLGKDGAFAPLLENLLNAALEGEMDVHMDEEEAREEINTPALVGVRQCAPVGYVAELEMPGLA